MVRRGRAFSAVLLLFLVALWPLASVGSAQTSGTSIAGSSSNVGKYGITPTSVKSTVGEITSVSPSSVPGDQNSGIRPLYAEQCHRQLILMQYNDSLGKSYIKFTGVHEWCFDGQKVTKDSMPVQTWISPKYKYQPGQDGYRYVASALKSTDHYFTYKGHWHGAQTATRLGRFEYRVHGFTGSSQVLMPFVSRTGHYDGTCDGPQPRDASPRVVAVNPVAGARGVSPTANIKATFSRAMNPRTLKAANFYLVNKSSGAEIQATYRYDVAKKTAILDPLRRLTPGTAYTATVFSGRYGALTAGGDPISAPKIWSFSISR